MTRQEIDKILELHKKFLNGEKEGKRADLCGADLCGADLCGANLHGADLRGANLRSADLRGANLDYSSFPLWCGSLGVHLDDRQIIQLMYHVLRSVKYSKNVSEEVKDTLLTKDIISLANRFHRSDECGEIKERK